MLEFFYQTGWGAFIMMLILQVPFIIVFLYLVYRKAYVHSAASDTEQSTMVKMERLWIGGVIVLFIIVNVASISYMPTVSASQAATAGVDVQDVTVAAESWSFDISDQELEVGRPVRFSAKSLDTMHGFAVYRPDGRLLFTLMLLPGLERPATVVHTFTEPGTYIVRCLEYCGAEHHNMRDEIVVKSKN